MEGTYPLPEAQRDRFMARVSMGYPATTSELDMLDLHGALDPLADLKPVADAARVRQLVAAVRTVHASSAVKQYLVDLVSATRTHPDLRLGASPRASLHLLRACRAQAALAGRDHVLPDDVQLLAEPVLAHRLLPTADAQLARRSVTDMLDDVLSQVPVPGSRPGSVRR
jgi:MoxR-like ATPase